MSSSKLWLAAGVLAPLASAILVTPNSPCDQNCGNVLTTTNGGDITCDQNQYGVSSAGIVFETCTNCELTSTYSSGNDTDLKWLLYNLRYTVSWCVFGDPGNKDIVNNPCITSQACGPLKPAFEWSNFTQAGGAYDYCDDWSDYNVPKCTGCLLQLENGQYMTNFVTMLDAACQQRPAVGSTISIAGSPFSTVLVNITTPTPTLATVPLPDYGPISLGARVGIAFGGLAFLLAVVGFCIVMNGKRRRRAFLRELEKRHGAQGWPHPKKPYDGGGKTEMFETPVSQRPLRGGWDESPVSVHTESTTTPLPRYFSPYASQYNSPLSASEGGPSAAHWPSLAPQKLGVVGEEQQHQPYQPLQHTPPPPPPPGPPPPAFTQWPTATQEKLMQMQMEHDHHELRQTELAIGVALGGDDASLRSKNSNPKLEQQAAAARERAAKGKDRDESYEMHDVESPYSSGGASASSGSRVAVEPHAPVLHHPGFGRRPSTSSANRYGGLTEEDARRGNAL